MAHLYPTVGNYLSEPLPPIQEVREVFFDEQHYHMEMEKMRAYLRERENTIQTQMIEIDTLVNENNFLKSEVNRVIAESVQYKDTLKRMYLVYLDQQKYIHQIQTANADLSVKFDHQNDKNANLFNEIQNMTMDKEVNLTRLKEGDKKYQYDIQSLTSQMNDKNIELSEMRRKVNDLIEIKRRLEEETGALRFSLDTLRSKSETELREKQIRIEQIERTYSENNSLKNEEIQHLKNKIKELDMLLLKSTEQKRAYLGEIQSLNKEALDRNYELSKIKPNQSGAFFETGSKENIRGAFNQSDYNRLPQNQGDISYAHDQFNVDTQPFNASGRRGVHFEQGGDGFNEERQFRGSSEYELPNDRRQNANNQSYTNNNNNNNQSYGNNNQSYGPSNNQTNNRGGQGNNGKNTAQNQKSDQIMNKMFKEPAIQVQGAQSFIQESGDQKDRMDKLLEISENATRRRLIDLMLQMWKAKFALSIKNRKGGVTLQDEKRKQENDKQSENMLSNSLATNLVEILAFIRRSSVDILFELYQRSIDSAESKKINSLIIFTINLRELKVQFKGLNIVLEMYNKLIILLRNYLKELKSQRPSDALIPKVTISTGKLWSKSNDERDLANKWIESTLNQAIEQKLKTSNEEKNKDIIFLFRLLTLKHKVKYPLQGTPFNVDFDLMSVLEHKICDGFRKTVASEF
ncbi:hypothetical protein TTHERM_00685990 (macronuclear) [Tetrahymena thermophila SB210]|uniref:Uncharacterized protein n=1 Tax=Tetrahymena thermophila (strain SB210) TaxID=312017 RepID=I7LXM9_TETTS|nr:hypothetical protein TTHERM_00685990 [Tetrahymena thermophila SB210]EAS04956.3 hypothetical protein TTHERM_00685990 [Tetrahymena thermophila SB210]|eukprot:XP_001025201.3 hypothetical protein TTHERM_00685990 [Tetrahymena thermophila SB210]